MSTRSYIAKQIGENVFRTIYCHSDGYLTHNGAMLLDHYSDEEKLDELLNLGDLSYLAPKINPDHSKPHSFDYDKRQEGVVVAYGRDRGEENIEARNISEGNMTSTENWVSYIYVFNKDSKWVFGRPGQNVSEFRDVEEALDNAYSYYGIQRPEGYYGFLTDDIAEQMKNEQDTSEDEVPVHTM